MRTNGMKANGAIQVKVKPYSKCTRRNNTLNKKSVVARIVSGSIPMSTTKGIIRGKDTSNTRNTAIIRPSIQSYNGSKRCNRVRPSLNTKKADDAVMNHEHVEDVLKETDYEIEVKPSFKFNNSLIFDEKVRINFTKEQIQLKETDYEIDVKSNFDPNRGSV